MQQGEGLRACRVPLASLRSPLLPLLCRHTQALHYLKEPACAGQLTYDANGQLVISDNCKFGAEYRKVQVGPAHGAAQPGCGCGELSRPGAWTVHGSARWHLHRALLSWVASSASRRGMTNVRGPDARAACAVGHPAWSMHKWCHLVDIMLLGRRRYTRSILSIVHR